MITVISDGGDGSMNSSTKELQQTMIATSVSTAFTQQQQQRQQQIPIRSAANLKVDMPHL